MVMKNIQVKIEWEHDYKKGLQIVKDQKKPMFLDFFKDG
jgi:hypothetical protein